MTTVSAAIELTWQQVQSLALLCTTTDDGSVSARANAMLVDWLNALPEAQRQRVISELLAIVSNVTNARLRKW